MSSQHVEANMVTANVRHAGKTYAFSFEAAPDAVSLRGLLSELTGVPETRMKVMVRGKLLQPRASLPADLKESEAITVIGSTAAPPQAPPPETVAAQDVADASVERNDATPLGLVNLGNTCYMNASLQVLRQIPELESALGADSGSANVTQRDLGLTRALRKLLKDLHTSSQAAITPVSFLLALRQASPQFSEMTPSGQMAQQDADEMWTLVMSALDAAVADPSSSIANSSFRSFVDRYVAAELHHRMTCQENPDEPPTTKTDRITKLDCNISISTNYLIDGIKDNLDQSIEKTSPSLNRMALYTQQSRLSRLPANLTIHMVRFFWRPDIGKKAKIMRKVKFPLVLDVMDLVTDELRAKMQPMNTFARQVLRDRGSKSERSEESIQQEIEKIQSAQGAPSDVGANSSGLYELMGVVSHKGASADSGHYIGWTRRISKKKPKDNDSWIKYDDDKVSLVPAEKVLALDGGGEDSVAYILLYRAARL